MQASSWAPAHRGTLVNGLGLGGLHHLHQRQYLPRSWFHQASSIGPSMPRDTLAADRDELMYMADRDELMAALATLRSALSQADADCTAARAAIEAERTARVRAFQGRVSKELQRGGLLDLRVIHKWCLSSQSD